MKNVFILALSLFVSAANADVINGFSVEYDPSQWTRNVDGNGSAEFTGTGDSTILTITGADSREIALADDRSGFELEDNNAGPMVLSDGVFTEVLFFESHSAGTIDFDWYYFTQTSPESHIFGWLLDTVFTPLSDISGTDSQYGSEEFLVDANQSFGFGLWSVEPNGHGNGIAEISNFSFTAAEVPEPSTIAFFALLCAFITFNRKKRV